MPDHSWLSRRRTRLPHEVHMAVFDWVLARAADAGLIKGARIGVDASTMEANAALRNIVRRDNGEGYREMVERLDRKRKGKKLSNEAKITKMKDGTTHPAYRLGHAVDLDTGAAAAEANLEAVDTAPRGRTRRMRRRQRLSLTGGLEGSGRWSQEDPRSPRPSRPAFRAGTVTRQRGARLKSEVARETLKLRAEPAEHSFAHNFDRGSMRRTWLRG